MGAFFIPILMTFSAAQFQTDNELSAVNQILGAIGQSPITTLEYENPEISFVYQLLQECTRDVQNQGWVFNTENYVEITPDQNSEIVIPNNVLRMDIQGEFYRRTTNTIWKEGKLYDKLQHTFKFDRAHNLVNSNGNVVMEVVYLYPFEELPPVFRRLVIYKAQVRAATQLVQNPQLMQMLQQSEAQAMAMCLEYECNQGDYTMMGWPDGTSYIPYAPFRALQR
jgi:hypothetical protein